MGAIHYDRAVLRAAVAEQLLYAVSSLLVVALFDVLYLTVFGRGTDPLFWIVTAIGVTSSLASLGAAALVFSRLRHPDQLAVEITDSGLVLPDAGLVPWSEIGEITLRQEVKSMRGLGRLTTRISPFTPILRRLSRKLLTKTSGAEPGLVRWVGIDLADPDLTLARLEKPVAELCRTKMTLGSEPFVVTEQGLSVPIEHVYDRLRGAKAGRGR